MLTSIKLIGISKFYKLKIETNGVESKGIENNHMFDN